MLTGDPAARFRPVAKYPVLLYQGGQQSVVSQFWSYAGFSTMAAQGYIVVAPNCPRPASFGQEWLDQISGDYSGQNIRDYLSAIDDVAREPVGRPGVHGLRRGVVRRLFGLFPRRMPREAFQSLHLPLRHLRFRLDVRRNRGAVLRQQRLRRPLLGHGECHGAAFHANSPHKFVSKWDTPILIITGEKDFRIPYTQSLEAFTAARTLGIPARLVAFENEAHQVFKPQNSLVWNRGFFRLPDKYVK